VKNPVNQTFSEGDFADELDGIYEAVDQLSQLEVELNGLFPGRKFLIHQMVLAVLMRMNVLINGIYGTGKSALIKQFFQGLGANDDELFAIELTRFTTESDVFGGVDVPALRNEGIQRRNPKGTIRDATFADIGEIFDAVQLLRAMHGILNERYYSRGVDSGPVPLHTAIASTNISPEELLKKYPEGDAVLDRFLFQCKVDWLKDEDDLLTMFQNYRDGLTPETSVDHDKLLTAAKLVTSATDQIDPSLMPTFVKIVAAVREEWNKHNWRKFSDRALCLWLNVLEANAILNRRYKVQLTDFQALKYVVTNGDDGDQEEAFERVVSPIIEEAIEELQAMHIDDALTMAMQSIRDNWPSKPDDDTDLGDLVMMRRQFEAYSQMVDSMKPELPTTQTQINKLKSDIQTRIDLVDTLIKG